LRVREKKSIYLKRVNSPKKIQPLDRPRDIMSVDMRRKFPDKDPPPNRNSFAVLPPALYDLLLGTSRNVNPLLVLSPLHLFI
jgi:hypothetical protein